MAYEGVLNNSQAGRILAIDKAVDSSTEASVSMGFTRLDLHLDPKV